MTIDKFNERVHKFFWEVLIPETDEWSDKCVFGGIEGSGTLQINNKNAESLKTLGIVDADKNIDMDQLKTIFYKMAEAGGGVIYFKKIITIKIPRPMIDKFFAYIETGTVQ
jgi:hypothetical protein